MGKICAAFFSKGRIAREALPTAAQVGLEHPQKCCQQQGSVGEGSERW